MLRPFVTMNMAMTADGKITSVAREYPHFTSEQDRRTMDFIRAEADAILIGAGTLRADDPPMHVRDPEAAARRQALGKPPGLTNILVSRSLRVARDSRFFTDPHTAAVIVATVDDASDAHLRPLPAHVQLWRLGAEQVDFVALLARLYSHGIHHLLVEGGAETNWHVLQADAFDELHVTVAPALLGGKNAPTWLGGEGLPMAAQRRLELKEARVVGDEIYCHYRVKR